MRLMPDHIVQLVLPVGNAGDHRVDIAQLEPVRALGIYLIFFGQFSVIFLVQTGGNHLLRLLAGKRPAVNQMYCQFSGVASFHTARPYLWTMPQTLTETLSTFVPVMDSTLAVTAACTSFATSTTL